MKAIVKAVAILCLLALSVAGCVPQTVQVELMHTTMPPDTAAVSLQMIDAREAAIKIERGVLTCIEADLEKKQAHKEEMQGFRLFALSGNYRDSMFARVEVAYRKWDGSGENNELKIEIRDYVVRLDSWTGQWKINHNSNNSIKRLDKSRK